MQKGILLLKKGAFLFKKNQNTIGLNYIQVNGKGFLRNEAILHA